MMLIKIPRRWELPESAVTPREHYERRPRAGRLLRPTRREVLACGGAGMAGLAGCGQFIEGRDLSAVLNYVSPYAGWFPVGRNDTYTVDERPITEQDAATTWNNFYEFSTLKDEVWQLVGDFQIEPWTIEIAGLVRNPGIYDIEDLFEMFGMEERIYRFRCVEAWAMTVPWSGFPLAKLVELADPLPEASHLAFQTAERPRQMPGLESLTSYPWPYHEGLRIEEATNELALLAAGLYGEALPRQNGAPLRLIVPWKYGYKSIKSIVRVEFLDEQPPTLWNTLVPTEYDFLSNVDPEVPHPRWSQASEWLIPDGEQVPTQKYNGYEAEVASLYR